MWGLRCPTPRGRTESCTLHILPDVLTGAHEKEKETHHGYADERAELRSS